MEEEAELLNIPHKPDVATRSPGTLPPALFRKLCVRIIPLLWAGYLLNIVDRTNLGYAQLQMADDLHLSPRSFGFASGVFFLSYALVQLPSNHALLMVGATRVLCASMVAWGLISTLTSFVRSEHALYALRFCLGLAESGYYPGCLLYFTRWFPDAYAGQALAYFSTAASVGGLVSSAGSGALLSLMDGVMGVRGWRWLLALEGVPTLALGLAVPLLLCEHPEQATWLSESELQVLKAALAEGGASKPVAGSFCGVVRSTVDRLATRRFALQYVGVACMTNTFRFFLPTLLKEALPALPPWRIGLLFAVPAAMKIVLAPVLAAHAERAADPRRRRAQLAFASFGLAALLMVLTGLGMLAGAPRGHFTKRATASVSAPAAVACIALLALADVMTQAAIPLFWSLHHAAQPSALHGASIAIVNSIGNCGGHATRNQTKEPLSVFSLSPSSPTHLSSAAGSSVRWCLVRHTTRQALACARRGPSTASGSGDPASP